MSETGFQPVILTLIHICNFRSCPTFRSALYRITTAYRPSTKSAHNTHLRTYLLFTIFMSLPHPPSVHTLLAFMEFLHVNSLSYKVILTYLSSIKQASRGFHWSLSPFSHHLVLSYLRSISINLQFAPTPRGIFDLSTMSAISQACNILDDPILFRAAFLTTFFAFFRMSNMARHSRFKFDPNKHILRQDVIFHHPRAHVLVKWTKTLQDNNSHHFVQVPALHNKVLCPVRAIQQLLASRQLPPSHPLFAHKNCPYHPVIDTTIRDGLRKVLTHIGIPLLGHGCHTFRHSGATLAYDNNIQLQHIMAHDLWRSAAVWTYLQNAPLAPSIIPTTFAAIIPHNL